jgi:hypothetical protein
MHFNAIILLTFAAAVYGTAITSLQGRGRTLRIRNTTAVMGTLNVGDALNITANGTLCPTGATYSQWSGRCESRNLRLYGAFRNRNISVWYFPRCPTGYSAYCASGTSQFFTYSTFAHTLIVSSLCFGPSPSSLSTIAKEHPPNHR